MKIERCGDYWVSAVQGPLRKVIAEGDTPADVAFGVATILKEQRARMQRRSELPSHQPHQHVHVIPHYLPYHTLDRHWEGVAVGVAGVAAMNNLTGGAT